MKNFNVLLQTLIDNNAKPNSILCFCRDLYEYKHAQHNYKNSPSKAVQCVRYNILASQYSLVRDWLKTFHLDDKYKPEDFIEL